MNAIDHSNHEVVHFDSFHFGFISIIFDYYLESFVKGNFKNQLWFNFSSSSSVW